MLRELDRFNRVTYTENQNELGNCNNFSSRPENVRAEAVFNANKKWNAELEESKTIEEIKKIKSLPTHEVNKINSSNSNISNPSSQIDVLSHIKDLKNKFK